MLVSNISMSATSSLSSVQPSSNNMNLSSAEVSALVGQVPSAQATSEDCGGLDPALCLQTLQQMKTLTDWSDKMKLIPKRLPDSYKNFDKLNANQHVSLKAIFLSLSAEVKTEMIRRVNAGSVASNSAATRHLNFSMRAFSASFRLRQFSLISFFFYL